MGAKTARAGAKPKSPAEDVDVTVNHSVTVDNSLQLEGFENVVVKLVHKEKTKIASDMDVSVASECGDINGMTANVYQLTDVYQYTNVKVTIKENKKGELVVKIKVMEKTKVFMDTDVDVLLTNTAVFDLNTDQTLRITQDNDVLVDARVGGIDLGVLLTQSANMYQNANVVLGGTPQDFTVAVTADQGGLLGQNVSLSLSGNGGWIA